MSRNAPAEGGRELKTRVNRGRPTERKTIVVKRHPWPPGHKFAEEPVSDLADPLLMGNDKDVKVPDGSLINTGETESTAVTPERIPAEFA